MGLEDVLWCRVARVKAVVVNLVLLVVGWIV